MDRLVGTISRGIRAPIIRQGDNLVHIVVDSVLAAAEREDFSLRDRDVIAVTEAVWLEHKAIMPISIKLRKMYTANLAMRPSGLFFRFLAVTDLPFV